MGRQSTIVKKIEIDNNFIWGDIWDVVWVFWHSIKGSSHTSFERTTQQKNEHEVPLACSRLAFIFYILENRTTSLFDFFAESSFQMKCEASLSGQTLWKTRFMDWSLLTKIIQKTWKFNHFLIYFLIELIPALTYFDGWDAYKYWHMQKKKHKKIHALKVEQRNIQSLIQYLTFSWKVGIDWPLALPKLAKPNFSDFHWQTVWRTANPPHEKLKC